MNFYKYFEALKINRSNTHDTSMGLILTVFASAFGILTPFHGDIYPNNFGVFKGYCSMH